MVAVVDRRLLDRLRVYSQLECRTRDSSHIRAAGDGSAMRYPGKAVRAMKASSQRRNARNPLRSQGGGQPSKESKHGIIKSVVQVAAELAAENRAHGRH